MLWQTMKNLITSTAILGFCCRVALGDQLVEELKTPVLQSESAQASEVEAESAVSLGQQDELGLATIVLRETGELPGRIRLVWPTGKIEAAQAEVAIIHSDEVLQSARTDETGRFTLTGLAAGEYVVRATIEQGSKDFQVSLVEFNTEALPGDMFLDATLTPLPDMVTGEILADSCGACGVCEECLATEVPMEECLDPCMPPPCMMGAACASSCGFSGGGCCGGGGGLGALAGLAGLAGLVGLIDDDDDRVKSPASP